MAKQQWKANNLEYMHNIYDKGSTALVCKEK